jgi:hypothetical protein
MSFFAKLAYCLFKAASFSSGRQMSPGELGIQQEEFAKKTGFSNFMRRDAILDQMSEEEVGRVYILFAEKCEYVGDDPSFFCCNGSALKARGQFAREVRRFLN